MAQSGECMLHCYCLLESREFRNVIIRYIYDGMAISNGRICLLPLEENTSTISGLQICDALRMDGVDLDRFYPAVYESKLSQGGWFPLEKDGVDRGLEFPIPSKNDSIGPFFIPKASVRPITIQFVIIRPT